MKYDDERVRAMRDSLSRQASESGLVHAVLHPGDMRGAMRFAAISNEGMATMLGYGHPVTASTSRDLPVQVLRARFSAIASMHATHGAWAALAHPDGTTESFGAAHHHPDTDLAA